MNALLPFIALGLAVAVTGCRGFGTQPFKAMSPSDLPTLLDSSEIVLEVKCTKVEGRADYSLWENMQMLAPVPKRHKVNLSLEVERVLKGDFRQPTLQLHWLRSPTEEQAATLQIPYRRWTQFTNGVLLRIGFDSRSNKRLRDLKLQMRKE